MPHTANVRSPISADAFDTLRSQASTSLDISFFTDEVEMSLEQPSCSNDTNTLEHFLLSDCEFSDSDNDEGFKGSEEQKKLLDHHIEDWIGSLSRDDLRSLAMTLYYSVVIMCGIKQSEAVSIVG